ncbi:endonuclease domain-containing 1 protein [Talpa occidentalis]|uniref:endonuclease domain-containing 1 protein n=1 Tax=Talpa occidentalis TaxID=50954 RepID=UPI001890278A|nr:endonuclease domain-containing 1 protein [Talpa occidentalis]
MGPARCLALAALAALAAPPEARLVRDAERGFGECGGFFFAGAPPAGLEAAAPARLCQRSGGAARFATLYCARRRAPVFSAFRAPRPAPAAPAPRWLVEPQIDDPSSDLDEAAEEEVAAAAVDTLGSRQALAADYLDSGYQQGQLYPFSLSDDPHEATFALTNAVPMRPSFRDRWHRNLRGLLARALEPQCGGGEDLYLLAGAVPSAHTVRDRVAIPEFVWLAACCATPGGGWAMGFVQHTRAGAVIEDVMLQGLQALLPSRPQLFRDNCAEREQDTEKMRRILEVVNQVQAEERAAQAQASPGPLSSTGAPTPAPQPPEASEEGSGFLGRLLGFLAAPVVGLLRLLYTLAAGLLTGTLRLLWWLGQQVVLGLESGLCRLGTAATSYLLAIGEELLSIPWKLLKVLLKILRALLRVLCCLLKATCRVLGLPARVLLDVAAFPLRTVAAVPLVCRDVAAGLGGALSLLLDTASGTAGGLLQVLLGVCRRIGYRAAWDSPGEF